MTIGAATGASDVTLNGNGQALNLTGGGTLAARFASISSTNSAATGITLTGLGGNLESPTTNIQNPTGIGISVSNSVTGGTFNFGNTTSNSSAGTGVSLSGNSNNLTFADLDITPDANQRALLAQNNAGTLTSTSGSISNSGNVAVEITRSSGTTPLNIQLTSVSANGGANGIILTNTSSSGSPGGFRVIGAGGTCTLATPTCDGGTIQNTTGVGISLTNAQSVSLTRMRIKDTGSHGISGNGVVNFTFANGVVDGAGDADNESGMFFATVGSSVANLSGTALIENSFINGHQEDGLAVRNDLGTLNLTVTNVAFTNSVFENGILFETFGTATLTTLVQNSSFSGLASDGIAANSNNGTLNITALSNTFTGCSVGCFSNPSDNALSFVSATGGTLRYTIQSNTMNNSHNSAIILGGNDNSFVHGRVISNTITNTTNGNGIDGTLLGDDNATSKVIIQGNNISGQRQGAMFFNANNTGDLDITITGNTISTRPADPTAFENLTVQGSGASNVCTNILTNTIARGGTNAGGIGFDANSIFLNRTSGSTPPTNRLEKGGSASTVPVTVLLANNPGANGATADPAETVVVNNGTCLLPDNTPAVALLLMENGTANQLARTDDIFQNNGTVSLFARSSVRADFAAHFRAAYQSPSEMSATIQPFVKDSTISTQEIVKTANTFEANEIAQTTTPNYLTSLQNTARQILGGLAETISPTAHAQNEISSPEAGETVRVDGTSNGSGTGFTLPANESTTITFRATVNSNSTAPSIPNLANVTAAGGVNINSNTTTTTVFQPVTIAKSFSPTSIPAGGNSTVTLTLTNPNATNQTNASFTDTLSNMSATGGAVTGTCVGTTPNTLAADATALSFSGITVPASGSCTVIFSVKSSTAGTNPNTTSAVATTQAPTGGAASNTANLTVVAPPTIAKSFSPTSVLQNNGFSVLTISITNPAANTVALTGVGVVDNFPSGMEVDATPSPTNSCGTGTFTPTAGATSVSISGATISVGATCTFSVNVKGTSAGALVNTTGAVTSTNGGTGLTATATLNVTNTATWTGATSTDWNTASNWNPQTVPNSTNNVDIPTGAIPNEPTISATDVTVSNLTESSPRILTINAGRILTVTNVCAINGTMNVAGSFTCGSLTSAGTINFTGAAAQTIPALTYNNLTVSNAAGVTGAGNITINGVLTLTNGIFNTGTDVLTLSTTATSVRDLGCALTNCFVASSPTAGGVTKQFAAGANANFTFHVGTTGGTDNGYTPVALANINAVSAEDGLTVRAVDTVSPASISSPKITRYWELTETGSLTTDLTFTYLDTDDNSIASPTSLRVFRNTVNVCSSDCVNEAAFTGTVTGITEFSPWTIAQNAPTAASVTVGGRVTNAGGRGISNAVVSAIDENGNVLTARTNSFGYFRFADLPAGKTYVFSVSHRLYRFAVSSQALSIGEERGDINFVGLLNLEDGN